MKKTLLACLLTIFAFLLCSCSGHVETLTNGFFQYNPDTNDYSLFFSLLDQNNKAMAANADVEIKIINTEGEQLFNETRSITPADFDTYSSDDAGEQFLANIRIPAVEVSPGLSQNGTVYFHVYDTENFEFEELSLPISYILPLKEFHFDTDSLPLEVKQLDFDNSVQSAFRIDDIRFEQQSTLPTYVSVIISGEKIVETQSIHNLFSYKLYDSMGYLVNAGQISLNGPLSLGDKFRNDSLFFYDLTPGETYTLQLLDFHW